MKVLHIYNSLYPQSVAGAAMAKLLHYDCTLKDVLGITTESITTWIGTLSAVYDRIVAGITVQSSAATGLITHAQLVALDAKIDRTVLKTGTATAASSGDTITDAGSEWEVNAYAGMYVKTTGGTGANQVIQIKANSSQVLTLEEDLGSAINTDTTFSICATRDEFSHDIYKTSGQNKQALVMWQEMFPSAQEPLFIWKLAGDKTTSTVAFNAQNELEEGYITSAAKYFLRDLTDADVLERWKKLLFGSDPILSTAKRFVTQDVLGENSAYNQMYDFGKLLKESATALGVTI